MLFELLLCAKHCQVNCVLFLILETVPEGGTGMPIFTKEENELQNLRYFFQFLQIVTKT